MQRLIKFLKKDIWQISTEELSKFKAFLVKSLRIILLTTQGFRKSQVQQGASSLTYYTLLCLVPVVAILLGIARGFSLEDTLQSWLMERFLNQKVVVDQIFSFAKASLEQTRGGLIAGLGLLILFWSAIKILLSIEFVMNEIWENKKPRTLARKFSDYLAMIVIAPVIILLSSAMTVYLSARVASLKQDTGIIEDLGPVVFPLLNFAPYLLTCALFTFFYIFMPNVNVRFKPAMYAGLIAGILYQLIQWAYLYFQIGVSSYNAIYGTFAAFPLFLIWLHLSWVIFLLGAKLTFAFQNFGAYEFITEDFSLSHRFKTILSLRITHLCVRHFIEGTPPPTQIFISNHLSIPLVLTHHLLTELVQGGVLNELQREQDEDPSYLPAISVEQLTIKRILDMIDEHGQSIPLPPTPEVVAILKNLEEFSALVERSDANVPLKNL